MLESTYLNTLIETDRLIIRPLELSDFEPFKKSFAQRAPKQNEFDADDIDVSHYTLEMFAEILASFNQLAVTDTAYIYTVFLKDSNQPIGKVEFSTLCRDLTGDINWGVIGYVLNNQYWGQGYGSEAVTAAIDHALENLSYHRIEAHITPHNSPSIKVAEKAGMKFECIREKFIKEDNDWIDKVVYYKIAH